MHDVGYDPYTDGVYYTTVNYACVPKLAPKTTMDPPDASIFASINPACGANGLGGFNGDGKGEYPSRANSAESFPSIIAYYQGQCLLGTSQCDAARAFGDKAYGAIWGNCTLTSGGGSTYYCDSHYVSDASGELRDSEIGAFKWTGFFFGVGMSHQWPAARVGGAKAAQNRSVNIALNLGQASSARIIVTPPSGAPAVTYGCVASPCAVTVDDVLGRHLFKIQYLSSTGQVLSQSEPELLP
jgi:hypothetical protein